ncbi:hypothetical protein G6F45_013988 [Rhizopus arrhizus]|nr:hypothetical protein G6F48_012481 [Rhizopus delemar]KAG1606413.1 hypothetical protein G6F45_013988 [Rhizopus arrhizus]
MVRALSKNKQENIKSLVLQNKPYSVIMERIPNLKKSTLSRYANKFSPGRVTANPGRKAVLQWVKKLHQRNSVLLKYKYSSVSLTVNITKLGAKRVNTVTIY